MQTALTNCVLNFYSTNQVEEIKWCFKWGVKITRLKAIHPILLALIVLESKIYFIHVYFKVICKYKHYYQSFVNLFFLKKVFSVDVLYVLLRWC